MKTLSLKVLTAMPSTVRFTSPSNIALVKYWGKFGRQFPMNPSISMTLNNCYTDCAITYSEVSENNAGVNSFEFEGEQNEKFKARIEKFLSSIKDKMPMLNSLSLDIKTSNSFPHSAGIASSASAMSALCMCLAAIAENTGTKYASELSRLASGSACRSVFPHYAIWGESKDFDSTNYFAVPYADFNESFSSVHDAICIVSSAEKEVSSSVGHDLMNDHPFIEARIDQANDNLKKILAAMKIGDWKSFGLILENEALTLHALMMTSNPSFILLKGRSLEIIEAIRKFRNDTDLPIYFTIDAGPNIHILYPDSIKLEAVMFLEEKIKPLCENGKIIHDTIGLGPVKK